MPTPRGLLVNHVYCDESGTEYVEPIKPISEDEARRGVAP